MDNHNQPIYYPLENLEDVIAINQSFDKNDIMSYPMFKAQQLAEKVYLRCLNISSTKDLENDNYKPRKKWIDEGLDAEVLHLGENKWKKGKVRIKVVIEFCPDEPEITEPPSPLDDIRKEINQ